MTSIQIIPVDDSKPHDLNQDCECKPVIELCNAVKIVKHNAYDLRELIEEINSILRIPQKQDTWEIVEVN